MSILGAIGLDNESARWQRAVKMVSAFHMHWPTVGLLLEITNRRETWLEKIEARVCLVQPPHDSGRDKAETRLSEQWIKLIRDPERPTEPRTFHDDTGVMDWGEKARFFSTVSYDQGHGPIPTRLPDIVEITGLRVTEAHGQSVKTLDLRRHFASIAKEPPKGWSGS